MANKPVNANVLNQKEAPSKDTDNHIAECKSIMFVEEKNSIFSLLQLGFKKATEDNNVRDGERH